MAGYPVNSSSKHSLEAAMVNLFGRLFGRRTAAARPVEERVFSIPPSGSYRREVAGEGSYQEALSQIVGGHNRDGHFHVCRAALIPEPENAFDANAVRVEIDGSLVGYLPSKDAARYVKEAATLGVQREVVWCGAVINGGWRTNQHDAGHFGVKLDLKWPLRVEG